jgi:phosphohistidine phosphatase
MTKKLLFIRHGKATQEFMPDMERFITEKGIKRTRKHAKKLKEKGIFPDLIISSPAVRAHETAKIVAQNLNYDTAKIEINEHLYFSSEQTIINIVRSLPNNISTVFLVGHNNLWTDLANEFSSEDIWHLRTSGIYGVQFETSNWTDMLTAKKADLVLVN